MTPKSKVNAENKNALTGIDARVLGQIMAAQNILFVLPTGKKIAEFFAKSLCVLPGVSSCRVCLGNSFSQEGTLNDNACKECENTGGQEERINTISKKFTCKLEELPNSYVFALETIDHRFGFFIFSIEQSDLFELYKPFVNNLVNFIALSLENRLQKSDLQKGRDILENRVIERTRELQTVNTHLEEEIEVRRLAEEALQQSEEQFRFLFETMAQGVIVQDADSKILDANDAACEILGLSRNQLLGKTAYDPRWKLIHEDGSPLYPEEMPSNIALRTCKPVIDILLGAYIPEHNTYHWILTSSTPKFKEGSDKPHLTMTTFSNITERKKAEEELYQSQQVFRTLVENSPDIIARYDRNCKRTYVNPVYLRESKIPQQELLSTTPLQLSPLPSDSAVVLQNLLRKVLDRGIADSADVLWPKEDNLDHWYHVYASPEFDREGKVVSVMTISRDITVRKQAEQERLEHLRFFECLDQINRAIQGSNDLDQMMGSVLDIVMSIFNCDRAFLMYPCDPESVTWNVPMERNKPEYPGVNNLEIEIPMNFDVAETLRILLSTDSPVQFGPGTLYPLPPDVSERFGFKCFMSMALYPKVGSPWQFGIHQCAYSRVWTEEEVRLFQEIGRRLSDALTSLLAHRDLKESEQRYRMVFENSPVSIWEEDFSGIKNLFDELKNEGVTDIETYFCQHPETIRHCSERIKIVDVNRSALILHAATTKQELMINLANTFTPESFDTFRQELICLWNGENEMTSDAIVKTLAGDVRNVTVYFSVCPDYEDTLSKILVSLVDITGRKQAENALIKSETGLKEAQRIGRLGSWELDITNNILTWSDEIYRMFEIDSNEFGASYEAFLNAIHPDDREKVDFAYVNSLKTLTPYAIDHRLCFADGRVKYVQEQCETFYDGDGKPLRSVGIVQDITERKLAEGEIQKLNQELEKRVVERTSQLETANKELEAFSYSVSHDLRAPLRGIDGFSQVLLDDYRDKIDEQGRNYLQRIRLASQRMSQLIDDMLNLSRVSRSEMNMQQVNFSRIAQDIANELRESQPERNVEFFIQEGIIVLGDERLLRIVLENLLGNAWKFTSKHQKARIEFGMQRMEDKTVYFVRDDGAGFDMSYAQKLFGAFQRLHTTDEFSGTGIGLATVQRIIHRHGGEVWAEGEVGKGATFYFTLTL